MTSVLSAILLGVAGWSSSSSGSEPERIAAVVLVFAAAAVLVARLADDGKSSPRRADRMPWPHALFIVFVGLTVAPMALVLGGVLLFTLPPVLYLLFPLFRLWHAEGAEDAGVEAEGPAIQRRPSNRTATT